MIIFQIYDDLVIIIIDDYTQHSSIISTLQFTPLFESDYIYLIFQQCILTHSQPYIINLRFRALQARVAHKSSRHAWQYVDYLLIN